MTPFIPATQPKTRYVAWHPDPAFIITKRKILAQPGIWIPARQIHGSIRMFSRAQLHQFARDSSYQFNTNSRLTCALIRLRPFLELRYLGLWSIFFDAVKSI